MRRTAHGREGRVGDQSSGSTMVARNGPTKRSNIGANAPEASASFMTDQSACGARSNQHLGNGTEMLAQGRVFGDDESALSAGGTAGRYR